jgi:D-aspartate ligase
MSKQELAGVKVLVLGSGISLIGTIRVLGGDGASVLALPNVDPTTQRSRWYRPAPRELCDLTPDTLASGLDGIADGTVLMPCSDSWVQAVARMPQALRQRYPSCVASPTALDALVDKALFGATMDRLGLPHPHTLAVANEANLRAVPESGWESRFLKPADSQRFFAKFRMKAFPIAGLEESLTNLRACDEDGLPMMLQEYIPGSAASHYFVDGFIDRAGTTRALFGRRRVRMFPTDFGNSTLMVSVPEVDVAAAAQTLATLFADLKYHGIFSAEFKRDDRDGLFKLLEVNARPWWYVEYAARCGVDVCALAVKDALGIPVSTIRGYAVGRRCVYPSYDWSAAQIERSRGRLSLFEMTRSWLGAYQPVFRWNDPAPALGSVVQTIRRHLG